MIGIEWYRITANVIRMVRNFIFSLPYNGGALRRALRVRQQPLVWDSF
jgi:hypothetical protein